MNNWLKKGFSYCILWAFS